ncbi:hypothetical protein [Schleiferilactobacillus harbinensis]|jgi:hypothetical protein|uniref:hypothetical protein n=1 Tax=Schleiferilactobacillus harbinensis TaxID=304207 RepID=UPI0039E855B8
MKNVKLIHSVLFAGLTVLTLTAIAPTAFAAESSASQQAGNSVVTSQGAIGTTSYEDLTVATSKAFTTPTEFQAIQQYVTVKNNQYVLEIPAHVAVAPSVVADANKNLSVANSAVAQNHLVINTKTLLATAATTSTAVRTYQTASINSVAVANQAQNIVYAWGVRSVFRSNAQVNDRVWIYQQISGGANIVATAGGLMAGFPWAALIASGGGGIVSQRAGDWADHLQSYNNSHPHNYIYQDINWASFDSEGVWNG